MPWMTRELSEVSSGRGDTPPENSLGLAQVATQGAAPIEVEVGGTEKKRGALEFPDGLSLPREAGRSGGSRAMEDGNGGGPGWTLLRGEQLLGFALKGGCWLFRDGRRVRLFFLS